MYVFHLFIVKVTHTKYIIMVYNNGKLTFYMNFEMLNFYVMGSLVNVKKADFPSNPLLFAEIVF